MVVRLDVAAALAQATQEMDAPEHLDATLDLIVTVARDSMPGVDEVGISVAHKDGRIETRAATGPRVHELDELQVQAGEGPCLHAMDTGETVRVHHLRHEQRWPLFVPGANVLGLRSSLGIRLSVESRPAGAMNIYSFSTDEIEEDTVQLAELFAAHAGLALGHARRLDNLNRALATRKLIGLALGILMERLDIDEDRAFAYLTRMSATTETKLRDVAASVVEEQQSRRLDADGANRLQQK
jgi:GAF domain-containing protein